MNKEQAFNVITQALEGANVGHRFSLQDSATIFTAVNVLKQALNIKEPEPKLEPEVEVVEDVEKK